MIAQLVQSYGGVRGGDAVPARPSSRTGARAYGLMPIAEYRAAIALCIERDLRPRFARLGFELAAGA